MKKQIFETIDKLVKGTEETVDYTIEKINETRKNREQKRAEQNLEEDLKRKRTEQEAYLKQAYEKQAAELEKEYQARQAAFDAELQQKKDELAQQEAELKHQKQTHKEALAEQIRANEAQLQQQKQAHQKELAEQLHKNKEKLKQQYQQAEAELKKRLAEQEKQYQEKLRREEESLKKAEQKREQDFRDGIAKTRDKENRKKEKQKMKLICPHCNTKQKADYSEYIHCEKCANHFGGFTFQARKRLKKAAGTAVLIGTVAAGTHFADEQLYRYPTSFEYNIIAQCANASINNYTSHQIEKRIKQCTCALENTMRKVSYENLITTPDDFTRLFASALERQCR